MALKDIEDRFYSELEEGVREYIRALRNAGINTECSCHHEGYIQCQSLDPSAEIRIIRDVLLEMNVDIYTIIITHEKYGDKSLAEWHQWIVIKSDKFKIQ